ncbi:MAG: methyltransferase, partial [Pseudomonadota bacterium]
MPTGVRRALSVLTERLAAWRNRRIASSDFQTWASGFPLTRGVARREAARLYDLVAGFTYSQTLLACVELGVFEALRDGP